MAGSDAVVVVEDWISEHYFTSDAKNESFQAEVLKRRKAWDAEEATTSRSRFTGLRGELGARTTALVEDADGAQAPAPDVELTSAVHGTLLDVLGYDRHEFLVTGRDGVTFYNTPGVSADPPLVVVEAIPVATHEELFDKGRNTLLRPYAVDDTLTFASLPRLVSHLFLADDSPEFALVLAGRWALVAERARWAEGRYLAVNLQAVCERNDAKRGGEIDRALTCLDATSLAPDADGAVWWASILQDSVQHTVGVSKDLREGVRLSIELIANEVVARRRAQGLDPLPQSQAQALAKQSLRFLYRILFLLYAEASPEMAVLPAEAPEYESGYSLTRLRELTLVEIADPRSQAGTHLYDSLALLFRLVDRGHTAPTDEDAAATNILEFQPLRADLFRPAATALIDEVGLGNAALQQVLGHLLLSKESKGRDRGFISYVELGINQLGAVYEGLMSYTGSFATSDLYEVAPGGDPGKGSWVVPIERAEGIAASDFVLRTDPTTGESVPVLHERGSFVFRLSGRDRQQSASYYTPEVLTRFTVGQALEELLDQDGRATTAEEILGLTICEPALGSGAFAIEAVRQLAAQYLTRRQAELGETIPPEEHALELQRVKASIALHQVYGVDLNATAVEFAEIALWLDTMAAGLQAPWFGLHLRRGNSLIGARRAVYTRDQVTSKAWLTTPPTDVPLTDLAQRVAEDDPRPSDAAGRIPHWLLPAKGWGATADAKEAKQLAPERTKAVKDWRRAVTGKPTKAQTDALVELGHQAEELWRMAYRRLMVAEQQSRRAIPLWGREETAETPAVTREQIERSLTDPDGAYQRLRRLMDAWCALWFWPLTGDEVAPPTLQQWIDAATGLLGKDAKARKAAERGAGMLEAHDVWQALAEQEDLALKGTGAKRVTEVQAEHPWLAVCEAVAAEQGFFHWQLDFATVFARGGFDLQVGNPPWVRPDMDESAALSEFDAWWGLRANADPKGTAARRDATLSEPAARHAVTSLGTHVVAVRSYVSDPTTFPPLDGLRPDLYRCFMVRAWDHAHPWGVSALIHLDSHFTDEAAGLLRAETYHRLRRHWQFINELRLFDIQNQKIFGVNIYGPRAQEIGFIHACSLYHPETVSRSIEHDGSGSAPGTRQPGGGWDLRPHKSRIQTITEDTLSTWHSIGEKPDTPLLETRMIYTINQSIASVLHSLTTSTRIEALGHAHSYGLNETTAKNQGLVEKKWGTPSTWSDALLQGPGIFVNNPFYKNPNRSLLHHRDWSPADLESTDPAAIPTTGYQRLASQRELEAAYPRWALDSPPRESFRVAWRSMAANTGERTLIPALIPPGASHFSQSIYSMGFTDPKDLVVSAGFLSSLIADTLVRCIPKSAVGVGQALKMSSLPDHPLAGLITHRTLRLNCLTVAYAPLWEELWDEEFTRDHFIAPDRGSLATLSLADKNVRCPESAWHPKTPLRRSLARRQAQVEIDALVAMMLSVDPDDLCAVYRTQFAVLYSYDHDVYFYDANGRLVPNPVLVAWRKKGDKVSAAERTHTNASGNTYTYELPFRTYDREEDMRTAYAEFERRLKERT